MLEGLDRIDWGRLTHAYGRADEVPGWIRALGSDDAQARERAFGLLRANICHQGSRYRASAPAVPFLFELLEAPSARDRVELIRLLVGLAIGYPEWHVPLGFDPAAAFVEAEGLGGPEELARIRAAEPDQDEDEEPELQDLWKRDAYEAVLGRVGAFQRLTRDDDPKVRMEAVKALAWFPEAASDSAGFVREAVLSRPDGAERANAILGLGILDRYLGDASDVPLLVAETSPDRPSPVRTNAAVSLAVLLGKSAPAECLDVLLGAIQDPERTVAEGVSWHWLGPLAQAGAAVQLIEPPPSGPILAALCRAAEQVHEPMAGAEVFQTLLSVVIPDPSRIGKDPRTGFRRLDPAQLTDEQRQALFAIGRGPVWDKQPFFYGQLMDVGLEYGLPWDPAKFRALLAAIQDDPSGVRD
ncbi:HEAT repeat domain-containing protein [Paludisphaera soli]|uniref:HEAT repeat domain-containing protein n=1 Tax=Paludisphaera soli TaxID=2712865 RepID=UPI0013ED6E4A|nr:HEAT repeat domain-containing protein [Paludisphaera soli]